MKLTLEGIEKAVLKQCVRKSKERRRGECDEAFAKRVSLIHPLHTDEEIEGTDNLALIVFCGVALMYGFEPDDVIAHLEVESWQYRRYIKSFEQLQKDAVRILVAEKKGGGKLHPHSRPGKLYIKTNLVKNYINLNYPEGRLRLSDLPN